MRMCVHIDQQLGAETFPHLPTSRRFYGITRGAIAASACYRAVTASHRNLAPST